jgi:hypothetical protein
VRFIRSLRQSEISRWEAIWLFRLLYCGFRVRDGFWKVLGRSLRRCRAYGTARFTVRYKTRRGGGWRRQVFFYHFRGKNSRENFCFLRPCELPSDEEVRFLDAFAFAFAFAVAVAASVPGSSAPTSTASGARSFLDTTSTASLASKPSPEGSEPYMPPSSSPSSSPSFALSSTYDGESGVERVEMPGSQSFRALTESIRAFRESAGGTPSAVRREGSKAPLGVVRNVKDSLCVSLNASLYSGVCYTSRIVLACSGVGSLEQ